MIDWQKVNIDKFILDLDAGEVRELGDTLVFPVKVKDPEGVLLFTKSVSIRADFYSDLRALPDWKATLWKIFRSRVSEDLIARRKKSGVSIEDKMELMFGPRSGETDRHGPVDPISQP